MSATSRRDEKSARPEQTRKSASWSLAFWGWAPGVLGAVVIIWTAVDPGASVATSLVLPFGFLTALTFSVILHELGHFWAAQLLGMNPLFVAIGYGPRVFHKLIAGVTWSIRAFPAAGYVIPLPIGERQRAKTFLLFAAGPMVNAVLCVLASYALFANFEGMRSWFDLPILQLAYTNFILLLWCIIPTIVTIDGVRLQTDGRQLLNLLRGKDLGASDEGSPASTSEARSSDGTSASQNWQATVCLMKAEETLARYRYLLEKPKADSQTRLHLLDAFSTTVLMYGVNEFLAEADRYSKELYEAKSHEWTVMGTRGSVLVELGQLEEGMKLLVCAFENSPSAFDRGISAAYLALGEFNQARLEAAEEWLVKGKSADAACVPLKRIEALVAARRKCGV